MHQDRTQVFQMVSLQGRMQSYWEFSPLSDIQRPTLFLAKCTLHGAQKSPVSKDIALYVTVFLALFWILIHLYWGLILVHFDEPPM